MNCVANGKLLKEKIFNDYIGRHKGTLEELMVKNLENVQGDERDIVIICLKGNSTFIHNRRMSKYFTESLFKKIETINIRQYFIYK